MHVTTDVILETNQAKLAELGLHELLGNLLDRLLVLEPITNEIGNAAHLQSVLAGEHLELRPARHRAVLVQNLDDHRRRFDACEACEIAARLRVAGAGQHAARLRHQRKDVARLAQIIRLCVIRDRDTYRARAIVSGDAGRNTFGGLDRQREIR